MARKRMTFTKDQLGPDIDLDEEAVYLADGRRLTEDLAAEIAEDAVARYRGRPSVSGGRVRTPSLTIRVPTATRSSLEAIAAARGKRVSDVGREALEEYIKRHNPGRVAAITVSAAASRAAKPPAAKVPRTTSATSRTKKA